MTTPQDQTVMGVHAPPPRLTRGAAFAVAVALSVPVFAVLSLLDWLM
ncbi:MAG: hypothetical protein OIF47_00935 [Marinibacterium sp.]|nr:hypothetical protein [Marinibacterium sp.]